MNYHCIRCDDTWDYDLPGKGESHGLCTDCLRECLIPTVRRKQRNEGNPDCFGRAGAYCDQLKCKYRSVCLKK